MTKKLTFLLIIIPIISCCVYPQTKKLQKGYEKEDKELVGKLKPALLPEKFTKKEIDSHYLKTGWYVVTDSTKGIPRKVIINSKTELIYIDTLLQLSPKDIKLFYLTYDSNNKNVINLIMYFDKAGTDKWSLITEEYMYQRLAFIINNEVEMIPKVNSQITSGLSVFWGNNYTPEEMLSIKNLLVRQKNE